MSFNTGVLPPPIIALLFQHYAKCFLVIFLIDA